MARFTARFILALLLLCTSANAQTWTQRPGTDHWYAVTDTVETWGNLQVQANAWGGELATFEDLNENVWASNLITSETAIGLIQDPGGAEPGGGWGWVDDSALTYQNWRATEPNNGAAPEDRGLMGWGLGFGDSSIKDKWDDYPESWLRKGLVEVVSQDCDSNDLPDTYEIAINPSLDVNNDGIIDACIEITWVRRGWSNQWFARNPSDNTWDNHAELANTLGGKLAVIEDDEEDAWAFSNFDIQGTSTYIGLYQDPNDPGYSGGNGGWRWIDGTPLAYTNWGPGEPNNNSSGVDYGSIGNSGLWDDVNGYEPALYEMSSEDCDANGLPDSYEILLDASLDLNLDGALDDCGDPSFGPKTIIDANSLRARSVSSGDLDGDGDQDLVATSEDDDTIAWFENLGEGVFGQRQPLPCNSYCDDPYYAAVIDIDGDQINDILASAYEGDAVFWFKNLGGGVFEENGPLLIGDGLNGAKGAHAADLDNDGDADVLTTSELDSRVMFYRNNSTAGFAPGVELANLDGANAVFSADLDGDSDEDIIATSLWAGIAWFENLDGQGSFGAPNAIDADGAITGFEWVYASDIDNDGDQDLVTGSRVPWGESGEINWFENQNGGSFERHLIASLSGSFSSPMVGGVHAADIDGDFDIDVISSSYGDGEVSWHENLGFGSFASPQVIAVNARSGFASDLDGDGFPDLLTASLSDNEIACYQNLLLVGSDCNGNGSIDDVDIAGGFSVDCDSNGVPDECEYEDCNFNGVSDSCELADGSEFDCNGNGVLDWCDVYTPEHEDCDGNFIPDECEYEDCNYNGISDNCELADGSESDCNSNGVIDLCDIDTFESEDCNRNSIPDECDPDCDANGIPDLCDPSIPDCNENGVHDECDTAPGGGFPDQNGNSVPDECECLANWFCSTSPNTAGPGVLIDYQGPLSVSLNSLRLMATGGPAGQPGLFYYGSTQVNGGNGDPFGNGLRCVGGGGQPTFRVETPAFFTSNGNANKLLNFTVGAMGSGAGQITPGSVFNFQFWYRDPSGSPYNFNFSDAVQLTFCP